MVVLWQLWFCFWLELSTVLESLVEAGHILPWQALVEQAQAGGK